MACEGSGFATCAAASSWQSCTAFTVQSRLGSTISLLLLLLLLLLCNVEAVGELCHIQMNDPAAPVWHLHGSASIWDSCRKVHNQRDCRPSRAVAYNNLSECVTALLQGWRLLLRGDVELCMTGADCMRHSPSKYSAPHSSVYLKGTGRDRGWSPTHLCIEVYWKDFGCGGIGQQGLEAS